MISQKDGASFPFCQIVHPLQFILDFDQRQRNRSKELLCFGEGPGEGALFIFACLKKQGGGDAVRVVELVVFEDGEVDAKPPELQARARGEVTVPAPEAK